MDYCIGGYRKETGEATGETEEIAEVHLLHGDHTPTRIDYGMGFENLGIVIVPDEETDKRGKKKRSCLGLKNS